MNNLNCLYYLKVSLPLKFTLIDNKIFSDYFFYIATQSKVENDLDLISDGKKDWKKFLNEFWSDFKDISDNVGKQSIDEILLVINKEMGLFVFDRDFLSSI